MGFVRRRNLTVAGARWRLSAFVCCPANCVVSIQKGRVASRLIADFLLAPWFFDFVVQRTWFTTPAETSAWLVFRDCLNY